MSFVLQDLVTVEYVCTTKYRKGPFPLIKRDQRGVHYFFDKRENKFRNLDMQNLLTVYGPLIVKYLLPFIKDLLTTATKEQEKPQQVLMRRRIAVPVQQNYYIPQNNVVPVTTIPRTTRWYCTSPDCKLSN